METFGRQSSDSDGESSTDLSATTPASGDALEYLSVSSMQWSKGYTRPRISAQERKERHRLVQQRFRDRKRQLVRTLRVEVGGLEHQLRFLQGHAEAHRLRLENEEIRLKIAALPVDSARRDEIRQSRASWGGEDLQAILEVLDALADPCGEA